MTIAGERIVGEAEGTKSWHVREHVARQRRQVVVVECENLQLVEMLHRLLVNAHNLIVIQLQAPESRDALKHSLRNCGDLII